MSRNPPHKQNELQSQVKMQIWQRAKEEVQVFHPYFGSTAQMRHLLSLCFVCFILFVSSWWELLAFTFLPSNKSVKLKSWAHWLIKSAKGHFNTSQGVKIDKDKANRYTVSLNEAYNCHHLIMRTRFQIYRYSGSQARTASQSYYVITK